MLSRKVEMLNKEKMKLIETKTALEKSLHDLTMVDVNWRDRERR